MPVLNRIAGYAAEMTGWRRHLHQHPELGYDCQETAAYVAARLTEFGVDEIHPGIARTGLVAIITGRAPGGTIGLRADMDALPMAELTGLPHASTVPGRMHACGHDGHVTMLLGAAKYLTETRNFAGRVALIFQPAEEDGGGGHLMVQEGIMDRFGIDQVYGLHNEPEIPFGVFHTTPGALAAAVDTLHVTVSGKGGHGATPHVCVDPIVAALAMIAAVQTILSRNLDAASQAVISVTQVNAGSASNIIPETASFVATIRSFDGTVQAMFKRRLSEIVEGTAMAYGVRAEMVYEVGYPATVNHAANAAFATEVAREISGPDAVNDDCPRKMWSEDFSYMLEARPGAFLLLGQGAGPGPRLGLHNAGYDFNDEVAPVGASFFARLVERALPLA
jgi:amidohydrolase